MTSKPIGPFIAVAGPDGKVTLKPNRDAQLAKLPLPKRIAAKKGKKNSVRVVKRGTT